MRVLSVFDGFEQRSTQLHRVEGGRFVERFRILKVVVVLANDVIDVVADLDRNDGLAGYSVLFVFTQFAFCVVTSNANVVVTFLNIILKNKNN
jgi:hypothetical protein